MLAGDFEPTTSVLQGANTGFVGVVQQHYDVDDSIFASGLVMEFLVDPGGNVDFGAAKDHWKGPAGPAGAPTPKPARKGGPCAPPQNGRLVMVLYGLAGCNCLLLPYYLLSWNRAHIPVFFLP